MRLAYAAGAINVLLAANFLALVPFLGWVNYGHWGTTVRIAFVILDIHPDIV